MLNMKNTSQAPFGGVLTPKNAAAIVYRRLGQPIRVACLKYIIILTGVSVALRSVAEIKSCLLFFCFFTTYLMDGAFTSSRSLLYHGGQLKCHSLF